jgi:membrane fusion protein (multidrug efflux system)
MRPIIFAVALIGAIFLAIAGVKALQIKTMMATPPAFPPTVVSSAKVEQKEWDKSFAAIGSVTAVQGVTVSSEVGGKVEAIHFESGAEVNEGELLVQLSIDSETAQLRAAEAQAQLARRDMERARVMVDQKSMSTADFEEADAQYKKAIAEVDTIKAAIDKKTIRAPFAGQLGIRAVNVGQVINAGAAIVSLQSLNPVYVNFSLPQQRLSGLRPGLTVRARVDAFPDVAFTGTLSAINPDLNSQSRSVPLQATFGNDERRLRPGMFAQVDVVLDTKETVVLVPATAILYSPFGDSVFVIAPPAPKVAATDSDKEGEPASKPAETPAPSPAVAPAGGDGQPPALALHQTNVRVGETRGDFVVVTGVEPGQEIASSGVFKLSDGMPVKVDNRLAPKPQIAPEPADS